MQLGWTPDNVTRIENLFNLVMAVECRILDKMASYIRNCLHCHREFEPRYPTSKFCRPICGRRYFGTSVGAIGKKGTQQLEYRELVPAHLQECTLQETRVQALERKKINETWDARAAVLVEAYKLKAWSDVVHKLTVNDWVQAGRLGLSRLLPKYRWHKIRQRVYAGHDYQCTICGIEPRTIPQEKVYRRLHCHEIFEYDDAEHVQRLVGFTALCNLCHRVKHGVGLAACVYYESRPELRIRPGMALAYELVSMEREDTRSQHRGLPYGIEAFGRRT